MAETGTVHRLTCEAGREGKEGEVTAHVVRILLGFGTQVNSCEFAKMT